MTEQQNPVVTIYALVDPRTDEIKYIGQTIQDPQKRLGAHLSEARPNYKELGYLSLKEMWISELVHHGLSPELVILETTTRQYADDTERRYMQSLSDAGAQLLNMYWMSQYRDVIAKRNSWRMAMYAEQGSRRYRSSRGGRLAEARELAGLSQHQLARQSGVALGTIGRIERDIGDPKEHTIEKIAAVLGRTWIFTARDLAWFQARDTTPGRKPKNRAARRKEDAADE